MHLCCCSLVFIMYVREDDPNGDKVATLSRLLRESGIDSDIDIYHSNENIPDWCYWTTKRIEHCAAANGYILLICSHTMISLLKETDNNLRIQMVYGHIDRLGLMHLITLHSRKFIPVFFSDYCNPEYVPPSLSRRTFYYFPCEILNQLPQNYTLEDMFCDKHFSSLKSLIITLTGQIENPSPRIGKGERVYIYMCPVHKSMCSAYICVAYEFVCWIYIQMYVHICMSMHACV